MSPATYAPVIPPRRKRRGGIVAAVLLGVFGAPLLLLGSGLAIAAGPDDVMMGKETPIEQGAAYSTPEAFAFDGLPVAVSVQGMGETYVGVGNPVDVLDVVKDTNAVEIAKTPLTRVSGAAGSGEKVPDASQAPWWHESVSGTGTQELEVELEGEPVSFLAASRDGAPIKLAFGYRFEGLFLVALGAAGLGALLLGGAVIALLSGRRVRPDEWQPPGPPVSYVPPAQPVQPARPVMTGPGPVHPAAPRPPAGLYRRLGVAAGIGVLTFALAGCSMPAAVELEEASKVSLRKAEAAKVMADWNIRSDKAIEVNRPGKWKAEAWDQAASGPMLAMLRTASVIAKAVDLRRRQSSFTAVAGRVWSAQLAEYPMWAIVEIDSGDRKATLAVYEQKDALASWKHRGEVKVKENAIPSEVEGAAPVSAAEAKQVQAVADEISAYLEKPGKIDGLDGFKKLSAPRREMKAYVAEVGVDMIKTTAEPFDGTGSRMVRTPDGVLAMLEYTVDSTVGGQGTEWEWNPPFDEFRGQAGKNLSIRTAVTVAVLVPKDGDPSVLGLEFGEIMGAGVKS
ncbi:hypothetical protein [Nocardioides sp. NPDC006273]|uniref:hypothetical protein n=1 Tax=Nocardioides sp. NPDC006273 TaxID=3155598 RepID=UPI0033B8B277